MARILGDGRRKRTRAFTELQSHYLFDDRFGRSGKGNDKGKVEGMVGYMRRNFLVPVPSFKSFEALNAHLERRCLARMDARLRGHSESIGQRMERDLEALLPLPAVAYDACEKQAGRVSSLSLVRYRTNDYSAPVAYGHRDVSGKRLRGPGGHQLRVRSHRPPSPLLRERRLRLRSRPLPASSWNGSRRALDQAAPLQGWDLPEEFGALRRLLEVAAWDGGVSGNSCRCCRLCWRPSHSQGSALSGSRTLIRLGALSFDAVKHLVLCRLEGRPPRLDLELYPYLPRVRVSTTYDWGLHDICSSGRAA